MFVNNNLHYVYYDMGWFGRLRTIISMGLLIERNGIKQSWVAKRLNISPAYLSMILSRKRRLTGKMEKDFNLLIDHIKGE